MATDKATDKTDPAQDGARDARDARGRFAAGNGGGPGRPRRNVERDYLAALAEVVSVDDWRKIVHRARGDAMQGDHKAREWLSRYLVGETPCTLYELAADDLAGDTPERRIQRAARRKTEDLELMELANSIMQSNGL